MRADRSGALLDAVRGVRWPARRPVVAPHAGVHPSRLRGGTAEFTEYRLYRQGDDPRRLDWKLLARSDRAYVRLSTDRALLPTTVVVDASSSMAFPRATLAKWTLARDIALALAAIANGQGDPVGLVVAGGGADRTIAPRTRRDVLARIARMLGDAEPAGSGELAPVIRSARTARVAIVGDLLGDADAMLAAARLHVAAGGEVHVAHVVAVEELDPLAGTHLVREPEGEAPIERVLSPETRDAYVERFAAWRDATAEAWRAAGVHYTLVRTDEPSPHAVRRIVAPAGAQAARA